MIFSKGEMMCFNGIIDGKDILEVPLLDGDLPEKEIVLTSTTKTLKEKGIIDENDKFTQKGIGPIGTLQKYKMVKKHIVINQMRLGLLGDNVVVIDQVEDGYDMLIAHKLFVMLSVLKKCEYMRQGESDIPRKYSADKINKEEWIKQIEQNDNQLLITKYEKEVKTTQNVYYWNAKHGYRYDLLQDERTKMSGYTMRMEVVNLLELVEEK